MLFEYFQRLFLPADEKMNRVYEPPNQTPNLVFVIFDKAHRRSQCHAANHGHRSHRDDMRPGLGGTFIVRYTDERPGEFAGQHPFPALLRRSAQLHEFHVPTIRIEPLLAQKQPDIQPGVRVQLIGNDPFPP